MKLGVIVESVGATQSTIEMTREMNRLDDLDYYCDMIMFYVEYDIIYSSPNFALMDTSELFGYDGPVIATSLFTGEILVNATGPSKKFLYMWNLEWTQEKYNVDKLASVYMNPEIELIARSEDHAKIIEGCWKKPIAVIEGFNYEEITKLIA